MSTTIDVLDIFAKADMHDALIWHVKDGEAHFAALCSDTFWWATADGEDIETEADVALLRTCLDDLKAADPKFGKIYLPELYASRKRTLRPMHLWLERTEKTSPEVIPLFLASGPERDRKSEG